MTLDEFGAWADTIHSRATGGGRDRLLSYLGLGLAGEAGEVATEVKKLIRDGTFDEARTAEELGDVMYHWIRLCRLLGRRPEDILSATRAKIDAKVAASQRARG
jgi:NTP pyrophosphatase (non-canonical NTP hydrolase)